jgi:hypothetical protein
MRRFGARWPLGPTPGRVIGAPLVLRHGRPGLTVPRLVVHRLVSGRRRPAVLIRAPGVPAGQPWRPLRPLGILRCTRRLRQAGVLQAPGIPPTPWILDVPGVLPRPGIGGTAGILQSEGVLGLA